MSCTNNFAGFFDVIRSSLAAVARVSRHRSARWLVRAWFACVLMMGIGATIPSTAQASPADTMIKAVKFDDVNAVRKLLAGGIDPNLVDAGGMPMLVLAAREKSEKVAALLADQPKTDLEKLDRAGENAMMLAALNGQIGLVKHLIEKGAEVNKSGWTPLHYAATTGQDKIVKLLIDHCAYIDAASPNGTTPLMMAVRGGHITTVKLLLDEGADLTLKNQLGLTAIDFAKQYNQKDIADGLAARLEKIQAQQRHKDSRPPATADGSPGSAGSTGSAE
ncbi:ankyrin repeat domain-containing protein [Mycetohabitans sp. B8]|nr:ankyrin repeat domain-containing protein [Mycetohabitans sp. B8]